MTAQETGMPHFHRVRVEYILFTWSLLMLGRQDEMLASYSDFCFVTPAVIWVSCYSLVVMEVLAPPSPFAAGVEMGPQIHLWCLLQIDNVLTQSNISVLILCPFPPGPLVVESQLVFVCLFCLWLLTFLNC